MINQFYFIIFNQNLFMNSVFWGELFGTMTLIYLGNGVVANVVLKHSKGNGTGFLMITTGWAFAVAMGVFVSTHFGSSAAHLNPAFTVSAAVTSGDYSTVFTSILAQLIGAIIGATLVWLQYLPHWAVTESPADKLACFATGPAIRNTTANFLSEFLGTFALVFVAGTLGSINTGMGPFSVGFLVWAIGMSLGGSTGYAVNPARDLGPRIAHALLPIAGKGGSDWGYAWIPVLGPITGGIAGAVLANMAH